VQLFAVRAAVAAYRICAKIWATWQGNMELTVNVQRLKSLSDGKEELLAAVLPSTCIGVSDSEMHFEAPIEVEGKAYLAGEELIVQLSIATEVLQPCCICNTWTTHPLNLKKLILHIDAEEMRGDQIDLLPVVREEVLLAVDAYVECSDSGCPERDHLRHYLK